MKEREKEAERKNQFQLVWKCPTPQNQVLAATLKTHSEKKSRNIFSFLSFNVSREGEKVKKDFSMTNTKRTFLTMIEVWKRSFKNG